MKSKFFLLFILGEVWGFSDSEGFEASEMYCGLENMSIKIPEAILDKYLKQTDDFGSVEIYIGPKDDGGCKTNGVKMDDWYLFETRLDRCNTEVNLNETHVQYANYISISFRISNDLITRYRELEIRFGCNWEIFDSDEMKPENHPNANAFISISTPNRKKSTVIISGHYDFIWPQLEHCWAIPIYENGTAAADIQYDFIDNYCGHDDEVNWRSLEIIDSGSAPQAVFWIESFHFSQFEEAQFKIYCTLSLCAHSIFFCNLPEKFCEDKEKYHSELKFDEIFQRKKSIKSVLPDKPPPTTTTIKPAFLSTTPDVTITPTMVTDLSTTSSATELTHLASQKNRKWSKKLRNEKKSSRGDRGKRSLPQVEKILTIDFGLISPGHNYTLYLD